MRPAPRFLLLICAALVLAGCGSGAASRPTAPRTSTTAPPSATTATTSTTPPASGPLHFSAPRLLAQGTGLASVSCGSATSCIALDNLGRAYHFDGTAWSAPAPATGQAIGPGAISVSCSNATSCTAVATAGSQVVTWNGATWSAPTTLDGANGLEAVGCTPTGYCAAVDAQGDAFGFDGQGWQGTSGDWGSVSSISCVSSSFCMSASGGISQWNGQSWTMPNPYGTTSSLSGVSCPSASFCTAVDQTGQALQWNGQTWSTPARIESGQPGTLNAPSLTGVSCPTSTFCAAIDNQGHVLQWDGRSVIRTDLDGAVKLTSVSCPSISLCVVVDQSGNVIVGRSSTTS